jgi:environmental stress-induced protein Ves
MAWANGGGSTRQVAIEPPDGSLARGFTWRVSIAQVGGDGLFSQLPGIDRSLWLLRGAGFALDVDGSEVVLDRPLQRFDFAGETPIRSRLLAGPCEDLNVMVARGRARADLHVHVLAAGSSFAVAAAGQRLLVVLDGEAQVGDVAAGSGDALRVAGPAPVVVQTRGAAAVLACRFDP